MKSILAGMHILSLMFLMCTGMSAQGYAELDTIYTPTGFELGDFMATICIPDHPNGAGVVVAHGAYSTGPFKRETMKIWCDTLASNGYTAMTIDYYSLDASRQPDIDTSAAYPWQATTMKLAVEFLRARANRFHITTDKIAGFGMSAGAIAWGQAITWDNDDEFFQTDPDINDHVDAAVLLYGLYDFYNNTPVGMETVRDHHFALYPEFSKTKGNPIANTAHITTPVLLIHGTADKNVPYQQSVQFHEKLISQGKSSQLELFPDQAHVFELTSFFPPHSFTPEGLKAKDTILSFLQRVLFESGPTSSEYGVEENAPSPYLGQNYPNPFSTTTTIAYRLPQSGFVSLMVFDLLGREVARLVNSEQSAGNYRIIFDGREFTAGMYLYKIKTGSFVEIKTMNLVKQPDPW